MSSESISSNSNNQETSLYLLSFDFRRLLDLPRRSLIYSYIVEDESFLLLLALSSLLAVQFNLQYQYSLLSQ